MTFEYMVIVGVILMISFALQSFLGFKQIKHFGEEYSKMKKEGKVAIGRRAGKIQSGTIILFAIDDLGIIQYGRKMQGTTILAKFHDFNMFNGKKISNITLEDEEIKKEMKITRNTVMDAVNNYNLVINGYKIPEKKSLFGQLRERFVH